MPYKIIKQDGKFCVAKEDTGLPIKGGCHPNRAEAVDHLQALYANEAMAAIADSFTVDDIEELDPETITASFTLTERNWQGPIAFENVSTGDKREFSSDAISWDALPLPLLFQRTSGEGHSGSVIIGRVDELSKKDDIIYGKGVILEGIPEADEFLALMEHGAAGGVSVDGDSAQYQVEEVEEGGQKKVKFSSMRVRGLTAVAIPAFADASIELTDDAEADASIDLSEEIAEVEEDAEALAAAVEELARKRKKHKIANRAMMWSVALEEDPGLVASAAPVNPPLEWFMNPLLDGPTPLTITPDGQVFGHIATFGVCHIGMPGCTKAPKGGTYNYFHTGELITDDNTSVAVGHLTFNTGHADVFANAGNAAAHYDNTGAVGADVIAGEDAHGVWVAGALRPHLTDEDVRTFRAAPISGDWRRIGGKMELVAALSVNTPGFPVPRSRALVASAALTPETVITVQDEDEMSDYTERTEFRTFLADKVRAVFADAPCKTEADGSCYPASDYAYTPDMEKSSTWKLRLTSSPGGSPDAQIVGAALAALGKGFRGNKVQIPAEDLAAVKRKVKAAWLEANKAKKPSPADVPAVVAAGDSKAEDALEPVRTNLSDALTALDASPPDIAQAKQEIRAAQKKTARGILRVVRLHGGPPASGMTACGDMMDHGDEGPTFGYGPIEGADRDFLTAVLPHHKEILDLITSTDFTNEDVSDYAAGLAEHLIKGSTEIKNALTQGPEMADAGPDQYGEYSILAAGDDGTPAPGWEIVNWGGGKPFCVKPKALDPKHYEALKAPLACFKTLEEAQAHIDGLSGAPSTEYLKEHAVYEMPAKKEPTPENAPAMSLAEEWLDSLELGDLNEFVSAFSEDDDAEEFSLELEEFYNQCHDPDSGFFCEGPDGPGRAADNLKKAEAVVGKKAPAWMKNLYSRKRTSAQTSASKTLGKKAPGYIKDILSKRVDEAVSKNHGVEDLPIGSYKPSRGAKPLGDFKKSGTVKKLGDLKKKGGVVNYNADTEEV